MMVLLRSLLFNLYIYASTVVLCILCLPVLVMPGRSGPTGHARTAIADRLTTAGLEAALRTEEAGPLTNHVSCTVGAACSVAEGDLFFLADCREIGGVDFLQSGHSVQAVVERSVIACQIVLVIHAVVLPSEQNGFIYGQRL